MNPPIERLFDSIGLWAATYGWIAVMGVLVAVTCALLGTLLVVRQMSLMGDALSHAVLPGIALGFILSGSRGTLVMVIGAMVAAVLCTLIMETVHRASRIKEDAAMGVVFTTLFALGVLLIAWYADRVDLDQECVLFGEIAFVPLEPHVHVAGLSLGPQPVAVMGGVLAIVLIVLVLFYKEWVICSFDPGAAAAMGVPVTLFHYGLMLLLSLTVVSAFESVGAILVVGMLIAPAATASLWVDRLAGALLLAAGLGAAGAVGGVLLAMWLDCSVAGAMVVASGALFLLSLVAAPRHGLAGRRLRQRRLSRRIGLENVVRELYEARPAGAELATSELASRLRWPARMTARALRRAARRGLVSWDRRGGRVTLLDPGAELARRVHRAHVLWEHYLERFTDLPEDHMHLDAERLEHVLTPELVARIDETLARTEPGA